MIKFVNQDFSGCVVTTEVKGIGDPEPTWQMVGSQVRVLEVADGEADREGELFIGRTDASWEDWIEGGAGEGEEDAKGGF